VPDFGVRFTSGVTLEAWTDPPEGSARPTRLNALANRGHKRRVGLVGTEIELTATVGAAVGPLDAALDGRLFLGMFAEYVAPRPAITTPVGQSSVQRFTPAAAGHYTFTLRRDGGGGIYIHFDVQEPR
jgi:hypothetical protein